MTLQDISGTKTAVYCGSFSNDYGTMVSRDLAQYPQHTVTGIGNSILSNRISYFYNLHGPSMTLDTACSSSMMCFHLGNTSIQSGESDIAIVAGSALHFDMGTFITMTDFEMLSPDGRCRTFDAHGNGYARGEGVCALVLRRRSMAEISKNPVLAVVRATGSNHDGWKDGLTLPNGSAQAHLIRKTYEKAGISTKDTQYFEAHGTGTARGDPIEVNAIGEVFAPERKDPLLVGSIKSNLGHLEGASGIAGIIKTVMCLRNGKIVPNMHFNTPNPLIDFDSLKITVPTKLHHWPQCVTRRASVNSFGYGGSNVHAILEQYHPALGDVSRVNDSAMPVLQERPFLLPWSAHSDNAARNMATDMRAYLLEHPTTRLLDLSYSLSVARSMHQLRSFTVASSIEGAIQSLDKLIADTSSFSRSRSSEKPLRVGFVFTGQGAQYPEMCHQLIDGCPSFRKTLEECDAYLKALPDGPDWSCIDELTKPVGESRLHQTKISQPLCVAVQLCLVELLRTWGIEAAAVVGHSSGEIAAAYTAGILSFESAIICGYYRGLYMSKSGIPGAMIAVGLDEMEAKRYVDEYSGQISLAAVNSLTTMTLSGDEDAISQLQARLETSRVFVRRLPVEHAFHSHHMIPLATAFEEALSTCSRFEARAATTKMSSSVTARDSSARIMNSKYWSDNMTGQVRFYDALAEMLLNDKEEKEVDIIVEIGPHPTLRAPIRSCLESLNLQVTYMGTLKRDVPAYDSLLTLAGQMYQLGYPVDLEAVARPYPNDQIDGILGHVSQGRRIEDLPRYGWDHESRFWSESRLSRDYRLRTHRHPLLGFPVPGMPAGRGLWRNFLRQNELPWLYQHIVDSKIVFPAAGYLSIALEAGLILFPRLYRAHIQDVVFKSALVLSTSDEGTEIMTSFDPVVTSAMNYSRNSFRFSVFSYTKEGVTVEHCHGTLRAEDHHTAKSNISIEARDVENHASTRCTSTVYYDRLRRIGLSYGPKFQLLTGVIESGNGTAKGELTFDPLDVGAAEVDAYVLHPTLLDSALHPTFAAVESLTDNLSHRMLVPTFIKSMVVTRGFEGQYNTTHRQSYMSLARVNSSSSRSLESTVSLLRHGTESSFAEIEGLKMTVVGKDPSSDFPPRPLFFDINWRPAFDCLRGRESEPVQGASLLQMVGLFVHQHPDADVILFARNTEDIEAFMQVIQQAGSHLYRSLTIIPSRSTWTEEDKVEISSKFTMVSFANASHAINESELVVDLTLTHQLEDISSLLRPDGFFISGAGHSGTSTMELFVSNEDMSIWRKSAPRKPHHIHSTTIVIADTCSKKTLDLVTAIKASYDGNLTVLPLSELRTRSNIADNVMVLVSLDQDIVMSPTKEEFETLQILLGRQKIFWITESATHETQHPEQSMIPGLLRTVRSENENTKAVWLDLEPSFDPQRSGKTAVMVLQHTGTDDEFAHRNGILLIPRISASRGLNDKYQSSGSVGAPRLERFREDDCPRNLSLTIKETGLLDSLVFEEDEDILSSADLGDNEIEVETKASALNFRDIAAAIGIIDDHKLGDELAGVVTRTGLNIQPDQFQVGDRVAVVRPGQGAHRSLVRTDAELCLKIGDMDFVIATSFPGILVTAYYSIIDIGRLQQGEYCLIHAAAGGVGQMAIQLAQSVGANVIATVGSHEKRQFLKETFSLTDDMIFSSRDDSFVDGVMRVTNGRGFDVALNSLAGDLLQDTWRCIAPFGRMIEIGKRDIHENSKLDMDPFRTNVVYASVDLITMYFKDKRLLGNLFRKCFSLVAEGTIRPPAPISVYSYAEVQKAFRALQMGKKFGKIVLVPNADDMVPVLPPVRRSTQLFKADKYYLLVGGLGGIGRPLAEWMYRRGARKFAFLSRSGATKPESRELVDWLSTRGASVEVFHGDAADPDMVQECVQQIGYNLAGIFQAAMVLRDNLFQRMRIEDWRACITPKVHGTYQLHKATINLALDFFVCFSSSSAVVGALGQANYAAANAYVDGLMRFRRGQNLPGTTMNVGVVSDMGVVAEDSALEKILDRLGYDTVKEEEVFHQVEEAINTSSPKIKPASIYDDIEHHRTITGINLRRTDLYWAKKPLFWNLYANLDVSMSSQGKPQNSLAHLRRTIDPQKRLDILLESFLVKVADVMGTPVASLRSDNPLSMYGLDSIVAVEIRKWFYQSTGLDIPLFDIMGARSIEILVKQVSDAMVVESDQESTPVFSPKPSQEVEATDTLPSAKDDPLVQEFKPSHTVTKTTLTGFQQRLFDSHIVLEDKSVLNLVLTSTLRGKPDAKLLQSAFAELSRRNGSLRTAYQTSEDGSTWQSIVPVPDLEIDQINLTQVENHTTALDEIISERRKITLDLQHGEMMRITLSKVSEDDYRLLLVLHHLASDKSSTMSFIRQLTDIYDTLKAEKALERVPSPSMSYIHFSMWLQQRLESQEALQDLAWWSERLAHLPDPKQLLSLAAPIGEQPSRRITMFTFQPHELRRMRRFASRVGATPFHFILATLRAFVQLHTHHDDLVILIVDGNRVHPAFDDTLGYFVNLIPLRFSDSQTQNSSSFSDMVFCTRSAVLEAQSHTILPFEALHQRLAQDGVVDPTRPLAQLVVNYLTAGRVPSFRTSDFTINDVDVQDIPGTFELAIEVTEDEHQGLTFRMEYDAGMYEMSAMGHMTEQLHLFMSDLVKDWQQPLETAWKYVNSSLTLRSEP
ncbi:hypothetical protein E4T49_06112 [Aureobasidium sp. EXF-10728]|nr:hypothetical protein E4T49_06112 [Aureobasidium sp. EXF-10728]